MEIWSSYSGSLVCDKSLSLEFFQNSLSGFGFCHLILMCLTVRLLELPCLEFVELCVFHQIWVFTHYFFRYSPCPFLSLFPSRTPIVCMFTCWIMFRRFRSLRPSSVFFLCVPLIDHWSDLIFKLADYYSHLLQFTFESLWWLFISVIVVFSCKKKFLVSF